MPGLLVTGGTADDRVTPEFLEVDDHRDPVGVGAVAGGTTPLVDGHHGGGFDHHRGHGRAHEEQCRRGRTGHPDQESTTSGENLSVCGHGGASR